MTTCKELNYDWKSGIPKLLKVKDDYSIPINYFTCGDYYYDGYNYVVKFPEGMKLYHGGDIENEEFPIGKSFYEPLKYNDPTKINTEQLLDSLEQKSNDTADSLSKNISTSWYTDADSALKESSNKRVECYTLKREAIFVLLDNDHNLWKLYGSSNMPNDIKLSLKSVYGGGVDFQPKKSESYPNVSFGVNKYVNFKTDDIQKISNWFCKVYNKRGYAGFAINTSKSSSGILIKKDIISNLKFMFCNVLKYMKRDLYNPRDWQYRLRSTNTIIEQFLEQLSLYKTVDIESQAGDLLEHSIWTLLFAENFMSNDIERKPPIELQQRIAATALIHDIGKMIPGISFTGPNGIKIRPVRIRKYDAIYESLSFHALRGSEYIDGTKLFPILGGIPLSIIDRMNFDTILNELGIDNTKLNEVSITVKNHELLKKYIDLLVGNKININDAVKSYVSEIGTEYSNSQYYSILVVSLSSELASRPYGIRNGISIMKKKSKFFPFISNMPTNHSGNNFWDSTTSLHNEFINKVWKLISPNDKSTTPFITNKSISKDNEPIIAPLSSIVPEEAEESIEKESPETFVKQPIPSPRSKESANVSPISTTRPSSVAESVEEAEETLRPISQLSVEKRSLPSRSMSSSIGSATSLMSGSLPPLSPITSSYAPYPSTSTPLSSGQAESRALSRRTGRSTALSSYEPGSSYISGPMYPSPIPPLREEAEPRRESEFYRLEKRRTEPESSSGAAGVAAAVAAVMAAAVMATTTAPTASAIAAAAIVSASIAAAAATLVQSEPTINQKERIGEYPPEFEGLHYNTPESSRAPSESRGRLSEGYYSPLSVEIPSERRESRSSSLTGGKRQYFDLPIKGIIPASGTASPSTTYSEMMPSPYSSERGGLQWDYSNIPRQMYRRREETSPRTVSSMSISPLQSNYSQLSPLPEPSPTQSYYSSWGSNTPYEQTSPALSSYESQPPFERERGEEMAPYPPQQLLSIAPRKRAIPMV